MSNRRKRTGDPRPHFADRGLIQNVSMPDEEKVLLKQVPAKVDGVVVGVANLYDDGSVDCILDEDTPADKIEKIKALEMEMGYNLVTGKEN